MKEQVANAYSDNQADGKEAKESFREKLNIKQLTFAKNDSNGSILEIQKYGQPVI